MMEKIYQIIVLLLIAQNVINFQMISLKVQNKNIQNATTFVNPVQGVRDSPDPGVLKDENKYYAVTTMGWDGNYFPIWQSNDLTSWQHVGWGINKNQIPTWTTCCSYWAPQIHKINNQYMIYYTARAKNGRLSIGVRHSNKILGPYTDKGSPIVQDSVQGVIDATVATDLSNNQKYLIYKIDGNAHGAPTPIYAIKLNGDGLSVFGTATFLIRNDKQWEKNVVQAPWVIKHNQYYYLFYSGDGYASLGYAIGVARSKSILGPYEKFPSPILHTKSPETNKSWEGPGHCSVIKGVNGNDAIVYHAWPHGQVGKTKRIMLLDKVSWNSNGWPYINSDGSPTQGNVPTP